MLIFYMWDSHDGYNLQRSVFYGPLAVCVSTRIHRLPQWQTKVAKSYPHIHCTFAHTTLLSNMVNIFTWEFFLPVAISGCTKITILLCIYCCGILYRQKKHFSIENFNSIQSWIFTTILQNLRTLFESYLIRANPLHRVRCVLSNFVGFGFFFFFVPLIEALYDLSAVSRILTMNCETGKVYVSLPEEKSMYLIFQIRTIGLGTRREKKSSSRFERYCRRSQSDSFKGTKKEKKILNW